MKDFFISYTRTDQAWAEWIAWTLEAAGYSTVIQAWDFRPGSNFVLEMQRAATEANRTIAVLSQKYLESTFTKPEWAAAFAQDPEGKTQKLIPVRIAACELTGILAPMVYLDLFSLPENDARTALLGAFNIRNKPTSAPTFPGTRTPQSPAVSPTQPAYPGASQATSVPIARVLSAAVESADPTTRLSATQRLQFMRQLNEIVPQQFNMLLFAVNPPAGLVPPMPAPQADRTSNLLTWAESRSGCGLSVLQELLDTIVNHRVGSSDPAGAPPVSHNSALRGLPEPNPFFTGREQVLLELQEALTARGRVALTGLGGVGKTQTAVEYAHRHLEKYAHAFWASANSREALVFGFVKIADRLKLTKADSQDHMLAVETVKDWLGSHEGWLLILDNADKLAVDEFIPSGKNGHLILTTQARAMNRVARIVEIQKMGTEEGGLFLLRRTNYIADNAPFESASTTDQGKAKAIAKQLHGLPLAIDQAGAYIEETGCRLSGYLDLYRSRTLELLQYRGEMTHDHPEPVATTWAISFEQIEKASSAAAELLRFCAFLPPDGIPEEVFSKGAQELGPLLEPVGLDAFALNSAIAEILKYSLLRRDPNAKNLEIHRLVQAVLQQSMDEATRRQWEERALRALRRACPKVGYSTLARCALLLPHTNTLLRSIMSESLPINGSKEEIYSTLLQQIEAIIGGTDDLIANLANVAAILKQAFKHFHWVGFYRTTAPNLLTLGPFQGPPACVLIPFEQGVCGTSARTQKTVLVPDVEQFPGHIACSTLSKSEIVVPLVHNGHTQLILDIDSDEFNAFDQIDQYYLELIVATIAKENERDLR